MKNVAYKNHDAEINELINLLVENKTQVILYNSHEGYGNTAFIQRIMYLLHVTDKYKLLYAELSPSAQNPLHEATKNIICKKNDLYQRLQFFSDEQNGSLEIPLILESLIKDLTQSETISSLFKPQESIPIYAGFYQDRLKQNFFDLIHILTKEQKVFFFIDNIQYMDNDSLYELQALLQNTKVTLIIFKSGEGKNFDKFHDEIKYKFSEIELFFPEPDINYVQKLATIYNKTLSEYEAATLLCESKKNVRKILCNIRKPEDEQANLMLEDQILKIIMLYDDYMTCEEILKVCSYTPYFAIITENDINNCIKNIEHKGLLQVITILKTRKNKYKTIPNAHISINVADNIIINNALSDYYNSCLEMLDYRQLCHAWNINKSLSYNNRMNIVAKAVLQFALKMGYTVPDELIEYAKQQEDIDIKILCATFLFCNANYQQAKVLLESILIFNKHRTLKVMYAISLNRCRKHEQAEQELTSLIKSSNNIDETTILVSFLISNHIHSRKISAAKELYDKYVHKLKGSKKYPYFLRNAATIFDAKTAYTLRNEALKYFEKSNDLFGYYSTTVNMTSYLIKHENITYALNAIQKAFDTLQQYNACQIHLVANNLGICYLYARDDINALKYLSLCFEKAKSIMPKGYAAINLSSFFLDKGQFEIAHSYLEKLYKEISESKLARLKAHFYLQCALVEYANGNFPKANAAIINTEKYCSSTESSNLYAIAKNIKGNLTNSIPYSDGMFSSLFAPCFLEYWTINSIDALSDDFLPR